MSNSLRVSAIGLLALCVADLLACGGQEEPADDSAQQAATPPAAESAAKAGSEAAAEVAPSRFDPKRFEGSWLNRQKDEKTGLSMETLVTYEIDGDERNWTLAGALIPSEPNKSEIKETVIFDVSGNWDVEGETLVEHVKKSNFMLWRVGVRGRAKIVDLTAKELTLERSEQQLTYKRQK